MVGMMMFNDFYINNKHLEIVKSHFNNNKYLTIVKFYIKRSVL